MPPKILQIDDEMQYNILYDLEKNPQNLQIVTSLFNSAAFAQPPFRPEPGFVEFLKMTMEKKRKHYKKNVRHVKYSREIELNDYRIEHSRILRKVDRDPILRKHWQYAPSNNDIAVNYYRVSAQRAMLVLGKDEFATSNEKVNRPTSFEEYAENLPYYAPASRILITENLTWNQLDVLPVYSDISGETVENVTIPESILYQYNETNKISAGDEPELAKAVLLSKEIDNWMSCRCHSEDDEFVNCYENEECECYMVNRKLQHLQESTKKTQFSTFKPILADEANNFFFKNIGYSCSDFCLCKGSCSNNVFYFLEKRIFNFELYRTDPIIGFGIRSPAMIPAGTPVMEFIGEYKSEIDMKNQDYAYQIISPDDKQLWKLILRCDFTKEYRKLLRELSKEYTIWLDPKNYGNIGRTALHSCSPNLDILRVFQRGLSPAHIRLIMVALEDIYPGTPLTLDYGPDYVRDQLKNDCKCNSFICVSNKHLEKYKEMDYRKMTHCFKEAGQEQYERWLKNVAEPTMEPPVKMIKREPRSC